MRKINAFSRFYGLLALGGMFGGAHGPYDNQIPNYKTLPAWKRQVKEDQERLERRTFHSQKFKPIERIRVRNV